MFSKEQLLTITKPPQINSISLKCLQEFYEEYICSSIFSYHLSNDLVINLELHENEIKEIFMQKLF
jgi:hypothetical protein